MKKEKECICNEVSSSMLFGEARTFKCRKHGPVTIDKRIAYAPYVPLTTPQPYAPWNPWTVTYTSPSTTPS